MRVTNYKELIVWQKAMSLVKEIYSLCSCFPKSEQYVMGNKNNFGTSRREAAPVIKREAFPGGASGF